MKVDEVRLTWTVSGIQQGFPTHQTIYWKDGRMKPRYIEGLITHLLRQYAEGDQDGIAENARITSVQTFEEGGYTDKPVGVVIECGDGSKVFLQFVGSSPSGGNYPEEPLYYTGKPQLVGNERYPSNGEHQLS